MINLIPLSIQKEYRNHTYYTIVNRLSLLLAALVMASIMLLLPSVIALRFILHDLLYAREIEERSPVNLALEERTAVIERIAQSAREALAFSLKKSSPEDSFAEIAKQAPSGVAFKTVHFTADRFEIDGTYRYRSDLLLFLDNLEKSGIVKNISSPLSNLLRERDAPFHLNLSL
jgi:Tfp pilus assembly protein PilN